MAFAFDCELPFCNRLFTAKLNGSEDMSFGKAQSLNLFNLSITIFEITKISFPDKINPRSTLARLNLLIFMVYNLTDGESQDC